ncbi:MAG: IPT/TIG domain-containing protein, partial [Flexibacteraceae bacterium]
GFIFNAQAIELNRPNAISVFAFSPTNQVIGGTVNIVGDDLSGVTVTFTGGVVAAITTPGNSLISVQVPVGALSGPLTISRGAESIVTTQRFTLLSVPTYCAPTHTAGCVGNGVGTVRILTTPVNFTNTCASANGPSYTVLPQGSSTSATLTAGQAYNFEITPNGTVNSAIGFWGDWNANGTFETTEYTSFGTGNPAGTVVSRSISLPTTVTAGLTAIRVRTSSGTVNNGSACTAFTSGETIDFFVTLQASAPAPSITSFTPAGGRVGDVITVNGSNLTGATFRFNGTVAVTNSNTGTQAQIVVPTGAATGRISVTTPGGTTVSNFDFTVFGALDFVMSATPLTTCEGIYYSPNSPGNYPNNTNITQVISPETAGNQVRLDFTRFALSAFGGPNPDRLQIFNGPTAASPALHSGNGFVGSLSPFSVQASNPTGQLTLVFITDNNNNAAGFQADLSCVAVTGPGISGFSPASGAVGSTVTITGFNFNVSPGLQVRFNGTLATVTANTDNSITVTVPTGATTGPITVTNGAGTATSNAGFIVPGAAPTITSFTPTSGAIGSTVTITGTNLLPLTNARFTAAFGPGANATVVSNNGITLVVTVPNNAATGPITVQTAAGTVTSTASFTVNGTPTITTFTASGAVGSPITIQGANFAPGGVEPTIQINGVDVTTVVNFGANFAQVIVPTGATTGPITITTTVGSFTTTTNFI